MKKLVSIVLAAALMLAAGLPSGAEETAAPSLKEEVVYGILQADGSVQSIQVVNSFAGGDIVDYGDYGDVDNLTNSENIGRQGDQIMVHAGAGRFYYQGTLVSKELPWIIAVTYRLDGNVIAAEALAGKSGSLEIGLSLTRNPAVNPTFFDNYMVQISMTLPGDACSSIRSEGATIASSGKDKAVAFTAMPGKEASFSVFAEVRNFSMSGMQFAALPLSLSFDMPDVQSLTSELSLLSDAVGALRDGAGKLAAGLSESDRGIRLLNSGSLEFAAGLSALSSRSQDLVLASSRIREALGLIASSLEAAGEILDPSSLSALIAGLSQLADGLTEIAEGMQALREGYVSAYAALDAAIAGIPETDADFSGLYAAAYGNAALTAELDLLADYYAAAKTIQGTYAAVREAFDGVGPALDGMASSVGTIAGTLSGIAGQISDQFVETDVAAQLEQLRQGLSQLSAQYGAFDSGLGEYTKGVGALAAGYRGIQSGMSALVEGIGKLKNGGAALSDGTGRLYSSLLDLPDILQSRMDEMLKDYDKSDFAPVSFVSKKNTNVSAVQFVLKTPAVEKDESVAVPQETESVLSFWQKLLRLFGL